MRNIGKDQENFEQCRPDGNQPKKFETNDFIIAFCWKSIALSALLIASMSSHFATVNHLMIGTRFGKVSTENHHLPQLKIKNKRQIIYLKFKYDEKNAI